MPDQKETMSESSRKTWTWLLAAGIEVVTAALLLGMVYIIIHYWSTPVVFDSAAPSVPAGTPLGQAPSYAHSQTTTLAFIGFAYVIFSGLIWVPWERMQRRTPRSPYRLAQARAGRWLLRAMRLSFALYGVLIPWTLINHVTGRLTPVTPLFLAVHPELVGVAGLLVFIFWMSRFRRQRREQDAPTDVR